MFGLRLLTQPVHTITQYYRQYSNINEVGQILNNILKDLIINKENLCGEIERWTSDFIQEIETEAQKAIENLNNDFEEKRRTIQVKQTEYEQLIKNNSNQENDAQIQSVIDSCNQFKIQLKRLDKIRKEYEFLQIHDDTLDAECLSELDDKQDTSILEANEGMEVEDQRDVELVQNSVEVLRNKFEIEESLTEDKISQMCAESTSSRNIQLDLTFC